MKIGSYCRVEGLQSDKGKKLNDRVGEIVHPPAHSTAFTSMHTPSVSGIGLGDEPVTKNGRVPVLIDGEWQVKLLKPENLKIMEDAGENKQVCEYTFTWAFDPKDPCHCKFHETTKDTGLTLMTGGFRCDYVTAPFIAILVALHNQLSQMGLLFNTPTVLHVPDLNVATALNKCLAGNREFKAAWAARRNWEQIQELNPNLKKVVELLKTNPHNTFIKWSPIQVMGKPESIDGVMVSMTGEISTDSEDGTKSTKWATVEDENHPYKAENFPVQSAFMPPKEGTPLDWDSVGDVIDKVYKGIYSISPQWHTKNCYDVIYAADGECSIQVGCIMDWGYETINEWDMFIRFCLDQEYVTSQAVYSGQPMMFWLIMMHLDAHRKHYADKHLNVFPFLTDAPATNRKLLAKRTTAKEDLEGTMKLDDLLELGKYSKGKPLSTLWTNDDWRKQTESRGIRMARIGALTVMVELGRRTFKQLTFQIPQQWKGTTLEQDVEAALALVNDGRQYHQAACVLLGETICCACCGVEENEEAGIKLLRCSGCGVVSYCGRECQKKDFKPKHKGICMSLKQERMGLPVGKEKPYLQHLHEMAPVLFGRK